MISFNSLHVNAQTQSIVCTQNFSIVNILSQKNENTNSGNNDHPVLVPSPLMLYFTELLILLNINTLSDLPDGKNAVGVVGCTLSKKVPLVLKLSKPGMLLRVTAKY